MKLSVGKAALQQALVIALGQTKTLAAKLTGVSRSTIWASVNAYPGSGRTKWENRPESEKMEAVRVAQILLGGN